MGLDRDLILSKEDEYFDITTDKRYQVEEPRNLERLPELFENGTWTWDDLEWIVRWKTDRSIGYFRRNDRDHVEEVIGAVVESSPTRRKLELLTDLSGLQIKMASAFLLFMNPEEYTVIDSRAGGFLKQEGYIPSNPVDPTTEEYINYIDVCRGLADDYDVDLRTLDRALWVLGGAQ